MHADQYDDLRAAAQQVPTANIDRVAIEYITNETNEDVTGMVSHYTLALYERAKNNSSWYILDGYYQCFFWTMVI